MKTEDIKSIGDFPEPEKVERKLKYFIIRPVRIFKIKGPALGRIGKTGTGSNPCTCLQVLAVVYEDG